MGVTPVTDDILTLSTGFLCAEARSVVSTLWSVDDLATALFSIFYYQFRKEGGDRPLALSQAQIKLRTLTGAEFATRYKPQLNALLEMKLKECGRPENRYKIRLLKQGLDILCQKASPFSHPQYWAAFTCQGLP